jgi:hypothetical protein
MPRVQSNVMMIAARRDKRSLRAVALSEFKAEYVAVKLQRPSQVGHLQVNVANSDIGVDGV